MSKTSTTNSQTTMSTSNNSILMEFTSLRDQIGEWAYKNFDVHLPELGIAEEIGELTHAILKREQKIRGEAARKTKAEIKDALGDAAIYMLDFAYKTKINPGFAHSLTVFTTEISYLGAMHRTVGNLILNVHYFNQPGIQSVLISDWCLLFSMLSEFADLHNLNLLTLTKDVWKNVSQRDWRKYPFNGLTK